VPLSLLGGRIAVATPTPALAHELELLLQQRGAEVILTEWSKLNTVVWDLAVVDCVESVLPDIPHRALRTEWRPGQVFGLVPVTMTTAERQALRPHLGMLLNKPIHHRALLDLLARALIAPAT
jgi:hypothetical protein